MRYNSPMPRVSIHRQKKIELQQARAFELYQEGLSLRDVGKVVGKSHTWVQTAVRESEALVDKSV